MKRILSIFLILLFTAGISSAKDIDVTKKPEPLKEKEFPFPEYTVKTIDNGMKVFIIEDHEQPVVNLRMLIGGGTSQDGEHAGTADLVADLLTKGAGDMDALEIAEKLDGVGASINASTSVDYITVSASVLKKHLPLLMDVFSDVIMEPAFPDEEMEKLVKQFVSGLKHQKSDPSSIVQKLARKVVYGANHPYAMNPTEEGVKDIDIDDIETYYEHYFHPNNATLAIVGDVDPSEIMEMLEEYFMKWEKEPFPSLKVPGADPMPLGVYYIERPASVQSSVVLTTVAVPRSHKDYETLDLAASVIGAGFAGRLFRTIREEHSYTYSPFGFLTTSKYANRFACGSDVRNSVTDSTIDVIKEQLYLLAREPATKEELDRVKNTKVGGYLMSFENSNFIAAIIQNADFHEIPIKEVKKTPETIMNISRYEVKNVAMKYMNPDNAYIVVVGAPEVREKLVKYGKIYDYTLDIKPADADLEEISMDCDDVIDKYVKAIGGEEVLNNLNTILAEGNVNFSMQGSELTGKFQMKKKAPNKEAQMMDLGFMKQMQWVDGKNAWIQNAQGVIERKEGRELSTLLEEAIMMLDAKITELDFQCEVIGKKGSEIVMKTSSPTGKERTYYFDGSTFLINRIETIEDSPQGVIPITEIRKNYTEINGIKMPTTIITESPQFTIDMELSYTVNVPIEDSEFQPEDK